jgi:thioredoxin-like negative regulator of GroEL
MEYKALTLMNEIQEATEKEAAALFYFSTEQCNVCKVLKPKVAELIEENFPEIKLFYVDIEKAPVISGQYRIFTIPTILVFFDGKEFLRKSRNVGLGELEKEIRRPYDMMFI